MTGHLAQRLGHQTRLQADVGVAHLAFDLGTRRQCRHGVDDDDVNAAGAYQHVDDLERLLTGVRLGDQHLVQIDAQLLGVGRIQCVLGIDEGTDLALLLRLGDDREGQCRLARGFRAIDLDHAPEGQAADAECDIQPQRTGGNRRDGHTRGIAHAHDGALAELALDLGQRRVQRLGTIVVLCHVASCRTAEPHGLPPGIENSITES